MSSTKIIVVFAVGTIVLIIPLVAIYIWYPTLLGRYTGLAENVIAGVIGGLLISLFLDYTLRRRQEIALEKVARVGLSEASQMVNRIIDLFAQMVKASSTDFVPTSLGDLFNHQAAVQISSHLALDKGAPVMPSMLWRDYIIHEIGVIINTLTQVQERYQAYFREQTLIAIAELRNNPLLTALQHIQMSQLDAQMNIQRPVLNIPLDTITLFMSSILNSVQKIRQDAEKIKTTVVPRFPQRTLDDVLPKFGDARFDGTPGPNLFIGKSLPRISPPFYK
ncbi:MAG: hypothetical protein Q7J73_10220 [Dehalococcoidales bacterium]|nr:hypothetical protein [Dehalococcoidales bacterium]